jgi:4-hydroxybenzoate polyprenyltransferase
MAGLFFFHSNLFMALCALACIWGRLQLFQHTRHDVLTSGWYAACVVIAYNLHYFYAPSARRNARWLWYRQYQPWVHGLTILAMLVFLAGLWCLHPQQWLLTGIIGLLATGYTLPLLGKSLNRFGIIKIVLLSTCWTAFTTVLPLLPFLEKPDALYYLVLAETWLFFFILCLLFDGRDAETDRQSGVFTLPVRLGVRRTGRLLWVLLALLGALNLCHITLQTSLPEVNAFLLTTALTTWVTWLCRRAPDPAIWLAGVDGLLLANGLLLMMT